MSLLILSRMLNIYFKLIIQIYQRKLLNIPVMPSQNDNKMDNLFHPICKMSIFLYLFTILC